MAKSIKGGYKNVSLKGVDLIGASPEVDGLYDALINSYDKPIQLCNIVIDGAKKKNAFVQVKKDGSYVIVENLYGYKLTIGSDNSIGVSDAIPSELPSVAEASVGNALLLDAQKKPVWGAISGGTKLYVHNVLMYDDNSKIVARIRLFSNSSKQLTVNDLFYINLCFNNGLSASILANQTDKFIIPAYNCEGSVDAEENWYPICNKHLTYDITTASYSVAYPSAMGNITIGEVTKNIVSFSDEVTEL